MLIVIASTMQKKIIKSAKVYAVIENVIVSTVSICTMEKEKKIKISIILLQNDKIYVIEKRKKMCSKMQEIRKCSIRFFLIALWSLSNEME